MVLDAERNLLAVKDKYIFLTISENIVLDVMLQHKEYGIPCRYVKKEIYPYYFETRHVISKLNKKIHKYGQIYTENRRYKILCYGGK